jgi:DNA-binding NarL/FixJ family response regulator
MESRPPDKFANLPRNPEIIFVSQESSPDVVQEALHLGARGYVLKTMAASDLLPAVEAVLEGRQFVSSGLIASSHKAEEQAIAEALRTLRILKRDKLQFPDWETK